MNDVSITQGAVAAMKNMIHLSNSFKVNNHGL
jgi:hypothetical protein